MVDLRKRFGSLVAAHRRRHSLTQEQLAEKANISVDMVSKIEVGATGARFPVIERLAEALNIDPAELFTTELPAGAINRGHLVEVTTRLAGLSASELRWITNVIDAALRGRA
ncbi:helix-turn-helix transcriptional regulator [Mesorhizobium sp. B3-1-7]|uniref:helix-turn-helix domain-containing protein n=1 Tax=Mesorhizobium sp. B3-1-7 TaxID=2589894 RepID=UPI00112C6BE2|nr:helix-turn-helix transcriptional regulator [Mesorhizobium sp. B3-1-7]TPI58642.1 helix-turn-helix transcriptional regulator [Mesorhizobium sp. B3-1-7]